MSKAKSKSFTYQHTCQRCGRMFFVTKRKGGRQLYCPDCRALSDAERNRERVRRWRENHRQPISAKKKWPPLYTRITDDTYFVTFYDGRAR